MEREVEKLRGVVRDCMSKHLYSSAIFFADKVVDFTQSPTDLYMLAQALFLGKHYRRALHVLCNSKIIFKDLRFRYLAAKCLEEMKEWQQCLEMLGDAKVGEDGSIEGPEDQNMEKDAEDQEINITAAICFLRGKAYDALENRVQALQWYKAAIKADPYCYEALECLLNNHMLTSAEEANLVSSLRFGVENGWLSSFYSCLIKKYDKAENIESKFAELERLPGDLNSQETSVSYSLKNNADLIAYKAEYYHLKERVSSQNPLKPKRVDLMILMQILPKNKFESKLNQLEKLAPNLQRVNYLNLYHGDYPAALHSLHRYFDYREGRTRQQWSFFSWKVPSCDS